jgi:uncharacterized protein YcfL
MKTIIISSIIVFTLMGCGAETEEEKNQEEAVIRGLDILYNMGKQAEDGASDEEVLNSGIDQASKGMSDLMDDSKTPLTEEEKKSLEEGGKGLKEEVLKAISKELNTIEDK